MKKTAQKVISLALALFMAAGVAPFCGSARAGSSPAILRHGLSVNASAAVETSGNCGSQGDGSNLQWSFDTVQGVLSITGEGSMVDYANNSAPWHDFIIKTILIGEGVTSIGVDAFCCTMVQSVSIASTVKSIRANAFLGCTQLGAVNIPEGVETIGNEAFYDNGAVTISIPSSVKTIGTGAFAYSHMLKSLTVDEANTNYCSVNDVLFTKDMKKLIVCAGMGSAPAEYVIPSTVTEIESGAFYICDTLTSITVPEGVEDIGDSTFYSCSEMTSVKLPSTLKSIGDQAFSYCSALDSIELPYGLETMGSIVFEGCNALRYIHIPSTVTSISYKLKESFSDDYNFVICSDSETCYAKTYAAAQGYAFAACEHGHHHVYSVAVTAEPTCMGAGEKTYTCECGKSFTAIMPAAGHIWEKDYRVDVEPTCASFGTMSIHCTKCSSVKNKKSVAPLPHRFGEWVVTEEPTCADKGSHYHACIDCGYSESKVIQALGHKLWGDGSTTTVNPTCTEKGYRRRDCVRCDYYTLEEIPATGHKWQVTSEIAPTCVQEGSIHRKCTVCNAEEHTRTAAKGHTWGEWKVVLEATTTEEGLSRCVCTTCLATKTITLPVVSPNYTVEAIANQTYTGFAVSPSLRVFSNTGARLTEYTDYTVRYTNNIESGTATATVTGNEYGGVCYGVTNIEFTILQKDISALEAQEIEQQYYAGSPVTPDIAMAYNGKALVKGTDYELTYEDNNALGRAAVIARGKGNFTGSKRLGFDIVEGNIAALAMPAVGEKVYTGSKIEPAFEIFDGSDRLIPGEDYTFTYSDNIEAGVGKIKIFGAGSYAGAAVIEFNIIAAPVSALTLPALADTVYNGSGYTPDFTANPIKYNGKALAEGSDFDAAPNNNINAGRAEIVITGKGNFAGRVSVFVNIRAADIAGCEAGEIAPVVFDGSAATPAVTLKKGNTPLAIGSDYTVQYINNTAAGQATAVITGKGNYTGEKRIGFVILPPELRSLAVRANTKSLASGKSTKLTAVFTPSGAAVSSVRWESSNTAVAVVDANGNVKAVGSGEVTITASALDEGGNPLKDSGGNAITGSVKITCTKTFIQRIVEFFRRIFGITDSLAVLK